MALVWVRSNTATELAPYGARFQVDDASPLGARMIAVGYWTVIPAPPVVPPDSVDTLGDVDTAFDLLRADPTSAVVRALGLLSGLTDPALTAALTTFAQAQAQVRSLARTELAGDLASLVAGPASTDAVVGALVRRDQYGNASYNEVLLAGQTTAGSAVRKDYVDNADALRVRLGGDLGGTVTAPTVTSGTHHTHTSAQVTDATDLNTASTLVKRDAGGSAKFQAVGITAAPTAPDQATRKDYVDGLTRTAAQISDATTLGRAVLTAADAPTARTALGAGTSSLALGTTGTTAAAGNDSRITGAVQTGDTRVTADQAAGTASIRTLGTGALQATAGNDARLSNARTPTAHGATHAADGTDPVTSGAWVTPGSGIANLGSGWQTLRYRTEPGGLVRIQGTLAGGTFTQDQVIFTLPAGLRPALTTIVGGGAHTGGNSTVGPMVQIVVATTGAVTIGQAGTYTFLNINGVFPYT